MELNEENSEIRTLEFIPVKITNAKTGNFVGSMITTDFQKLIPEIETALASDESWWDLWRFRIWLKSMMIQDEQFSKLQLKSIRNLYDTQPHISRFYNTILEIDKLVK